MANECEHNIATLLVNHEDRLNQIEHQVGKLQGRMPMSKIRRLIWWPYTATFLMAPVIGGWVALFGQEPWKDEVVIAAFLILSGKTFSDFIGRSIQGSRPHRSLIMKDHR